MAPEPKDRHADAAPTVLPGAPGKGRLARMTARRHSGRGRAPGRRAAPPPAEGLIRQILDELPIPLLVLNPDLGTVLLNHALRALLQHYGHDPDRFLLSPILDFIVEDDRDTAAETVRRAFAEGRSTLDSAGLTSDGRPIPMSFTSVRVTAGDAPVLVVLMTDLSDRQDMVQRLVHAQKMESLGRLAGGVAHDFNNLLVAVMSFTEVALLDTAPDDVRRGDLESIRDAVMKAADLTRMLLTFGRRQLLLPKRVDANALVLELDKMLRRMIGEDVELVFLPGGDLGAVRVDPGQLESALLNLAVNARDAMPDGGTLTITTSRLTEGDRHWVRLSVADTGAGMTAETRARIFEPFYSTKDGGSSGLGLASVHGFVMQSGGRIDVVTEPGAGTTFLIDLPELAGTKADESPEARRGSAAAAWQTILLAEDNPRVRRGVAAMLRALGHTVLEAEHGEEALRVADAHQGTIALLLSDVVMPKMNVTTLIDRMRERRPETRVLLMSGYTDDAVVRAGVQAGRVAFIPKPFTAEALAARIREVLG